MDHTLLTNFGESLSQTAKRYLNLNLSVIPVKVDKRPLVKWERYRQTKMTDEEAQRFFSYSNAEGIAVICGKVSGSLEVVDIDCKNDKTGNLWGEFYRAVKKELPGVMDRLVIAATRNKGYHFYYRCETIDKNLKLANNDLNEVLIETRGEGGYVIASPTEGYQFVQGDPAAIPVITAEERLTLLDICRSFDRSATVEDAPVGSVKEGERLSPFEDYNQRGDVVNLLEKHSWRKVKEDNDWDYLVRPGKNSNEYGATFHKKKRFFHVFTSTSVFETGINYTPFQLYATLETHGNYAEAARRLYAEGFGSHHSGKGKPPKMIMPEVPLPDLPVTGFPVQLQNFINACAEVYGSPRDYWAGAVISATALGIGNRMELFTNFTNVPVFWMALIGDISSGKSFPVDFCLRYFKKLDSLSISKYHKDLEAYERTVGMTKKERMAEGLDENPVKPECFQYRLTDFTPEAMVAAHQANNRGLLIDCDELKGWIDNFGRYNSSGEQSNMVSSWSGLAMTYNRKTAGIMNIPSPCISVCGGIQPDLLPSLAGAWRSEDGFLSRFCAVYPNHTPKAAYNRNTLPPQLVSEWEEYLGRLAGIGEKQVLRLDSKADAKYEEWFNMNRDMINEEAANYIKGVYGKLDIISLRLAIVIHGMNYACEGVLSEEISGDEMDAALALTEYFRFTALKVHKKLFENTSPYILNQKTLINHFHNRMKLSISETSRRTGIPRAQIYRLLNR